MGADAAEGKSRRGTQSQQQRKRTRKKSCPAATRDFSSYFTEGAMFSRVGEMHKAVLSFEKIDGSLYKALLEMGTLTFSKVASTILASVAASRKPSLSDISLKGKLDLSMWKSIGCDDDDENDDDDEDEEKVASYPPSPSPILAPLLATKTVTTVKTVKIVEEIMEYNDNESCASNKINEATNEYSRAASPAQGRLSPLGQFLTGGSSLKISPSFTALVQKTGGNDYSTGASHIRGSATYHNNARLPIPRSSSALSLHQNSFLPDDAGKAIELGKVTPSNNRLPGENVLRHEFLLSSTLQRKVIVAKPQEGEHLVQLPPIVPATPSSTSTTLLSIGSYQLSRASQFPNGAREGARLGKRVEFSASLEMEAERPQQQPTTAAATTAVTTDTGASASDKLKGTGSGKDGSVVRSRSGSAARRPSFKPSPQDLLHEIRKMSLASQDAQEEKRRAAQETLPSSGRKFGRKPRVKRRKAEEVFTDKDRAAAVTLGSKDIKQSLKAKKKRDRKMRLSISFLSGEEYVTGALLGEAAYQMKVKKQPEAALQTLNKALEIQPNHKGALVARSQCYLKLGDAEAALKDAELAWDPNNPNETYTQGLYQYAEALFQLGEFEKSLIAFHRGHRMRKDTDGFRIGIQKCQEAIRRAIGDKSATSIPNLDTVLPMIQEFEDTKTRLGPECKEEVILKNIARYKGGDGIHLSSAADTKAKSRMITRELMGQLYLDKVYLKKFITRPEVINQQGLAKGLRDEASDALKYLEGRERFWRQQNPLYSRKNFNAMLKAHAHDAACRKQSISADPSIAKFLERRSSVLIADNDPGPSTVPQIRRQTSDPRGRSRERSVESKSVERANGGIKIITRNLSSESQKAKLSRNSNTGKT